MAAPFCRERMIGWYADETGDVAKARCRFYLVQAFHFLRVRIETESVQFVTKATPSGRYPVGGADIDQEKFLFPKRVRDELGKRTLAG